MRMNKKASFAAVIILILLIVVVIGGYYFIRPFFEPKVTGAAVSDYSSTTPSSSDSANSVYDSYSESGCGEYGGTCCSDGVCYYGECQNGKCIHCGSFGEACCYKDYDNLQCFQGASCTLGRCKVNSDYYDDCGMIGYVPCDSGCYYGVYNSYSGICEACGDYEQPCCPTDYPCAYGQCISGTCKKVEAETVSTPSQSNIDSQDTPNYDPYGYQPDSQESSECGHLDQDCCKNMQQFTSFCYDGLDCRADTCVTGPDYEAYDRSDRESY